MFHELLGLIAKHHFWAVCVLAVVARFVVLKSPRGSDARSRFRFALGLFVAHTLLLALSAPLARLDPLLDEGLDVGTAYTSTLATVLLGGIVVFEGFVRWFRPSLPRIVPDLITTLVAFMGIMRASSQLGFELSGVIATSAVVTAVIGLSLQDTLGNALGGLALQLDSSINVGDWVKLGEVSGRVSEVHWRYTAIETRNWETVIVPNSIIMRSQVVVLGRRGGEAQQWRRWVHFQVDFRTAPNDVIEVVEHALRSQPLQNVATSPEPNCIAVDFAESQTKYAVRYWLTDLAADDPTDSLVRNRIYYALSRAHMPLAIPAQMVFVTEDDQARQTHKRATEHGRRIAALRKIDLFSKLSDDEQNALAEQLERAPFTQGEMITREGASAHHLYMLLSGEVSIRVGGITEPFEVSRLRAGDFFGEMALLTGERRRANSYCLSDVDCYRLDATPFRALLAKRPDIAEQLAQILAARETGLVAARERMDSCQQAQLKAQKERALLSKIRAFFDLT